MNREDIIKMLKQAGLMADGEWWFTNFNNVEQDVHISYLEAFATLVAKTEREACAKVCDDLWEDDGTAYECAEAIRARGQA
jgi:hypothetical protein